MKILITLFVKNCFNCLLFWKFQTKDLVTTIEKDINQVGLHANILFVTNVLREKFVQNAIKLYYFPLSIRKKHILQNNLFKIAFKKIQLKNSATISQNIKVYIDQVLN